MPEISLNLLDLNGVLYDRDREARTPLARLGFRPFAGFDPGRDLGVRF
jgi:hypothetical protein